MKYPKTKVTKFVQFSEFNCRQVNFHFGSKYVYIFIEPIEKPIKVTLSEFSTTLNMFKQ